MRRIVLIVVLVSVLSLPLLGQAAAVEQIFTPSGRFSVDMPDTWVARPFPEEEEIRGLDSEAMVLGTSYDVIDEYLSGQRFDGSVVFLSAYPYHVFEESVLGSPADMLADVTVFDLSEITAETYADFPSAQFYYSEPDTFFVIEALIDTGEMAYRSTVYSTRFDDEETITALFNSAQIHPVALADALHLDQDMRSVTTKDERLSFDIPQNWLYWNEGETSLSFATSGLAYQKIAYAFDPQENPEAVFIVQRLVLSALRPNEVVGSHADLPALATRLRSENGGLEKNSEFAVTETGGAPTLDTTWLVAGKQETVLTRTRLVDTGDSVYVIQAQFASKGSADIQAMVEQIIGSMSYTPFDDPLDSTQEGLEIGQSAPDFSIEHLDGSTVHLSDYRGKMVFLNMWATWCGPCHREAPAMQDYYNSYNGRFEILAVNVGETRRQAQGFVDQYTITFPVVLDQTEQIAQLYALRAYPTTYLISRDGVVIDRIEGSFSENGLRDTLAIYVGR